MTMSSLVPTLRGGEWLLRTSDAADIFTPEQCSDEQRLVARTASDFVTNDVLPVLDRLEQKDWNLARDLLRRCGELGLLGVDAPEAFGGLQLDKVTSLIVSQWMAGSASFGATFGAHVNLMVLPLVLFGSEDQKRRYLPRLVSGELVGAYCLSEAGSGSDALGAKARASRQADGSFLLNGEKMWVTNGGFADVYIVFAKVDGEHFSAFIVERRFAGLTSGAEEHKMGLHGSSTAPVILQDVRVPPENLLGEIGKGHKIAFNVLNFARFKLGAACSGGARVAIGEAARYAGQRRQFGQPIGSFGAIKHKLGEMIVRAYAVESLLYRTAGTVDRRIAETPHDPADQSAALAAFEEYAIEASIAKVAGSEMADFVFDENIQIHGGNGYVRDYPAERHYRDARVNRIFEGTNEINRLLVSGILARRAAKGDIALIAAARALQDELLGPPATPTDDGSTLSEQKQIVESLKKACLMALGLSMETHRDKLAEQQEVLTHLADMLIDTYSAESATERAASAVTSRVPHAELHEAAARVFVNDAVMRVDASARQALAAIAQGDTLRTTLAALRRLFRHMPIDTVSLRRELADAAISRGSWTF